MNQPLITIEQVRKSFGSAQIFDALDMEIMEHEVVCLIGASGSGKSTLLRCMTALEPIDSGRITIDDIDLFQFGVNLDFLRRRVGIVFQQFNLFPRMTVLDNLTLAPRKVLGLSRREAERQAMEVLARLGLAEKAKDFPDRLSGGQQQRVAISRALMMEPKVLLLDEVTSALDPELVGEVLSLVRDLAAGGMTLVLATHEMEFARDVADRICFLAEGGIYESGRPSAVLGNPQRDLTKAFLRHLNQRAGV